MFEEYIKNGTPEQKERAENWQIAIGLQDVDNLKVSQVLIELARRHIEGKITIEEVEQRIWCKCYNKNARKFRNSNVGISAFLL